MGKMTKTDFKEVHKRAKEIYKKGSEKYCDAVGRAFKELKKEEKI